MCRAETIFDFTTVLIATKMKLFLEINFIQVFSINNNLKMTRMLKLTFLSNYFSQSLRNNQKKMSKQKKNINLIEGLPEPEEDIENQTPSNIDKAAVIP